MTVPTAASQMIENFKSKGTLGQGAERQSIPAQEATVMDEFSKTIDYTSEADNEEGFDFNPKPGELLLEDANYTTEITVSGNSKQGSLMEVTQFAAPSAQGVIFMETNDTGFTVIMAELSSNGAMAAAEAMFIDRKNPGESYQERIQAGASA